MLAHADSSGLQYQDAPPTVTGGTVNNGNDPSGGSSASGANSPGGGSSAKNSSSGSGGAAKNGGNGSGQQGSQGADFNSGVGGGKSLGNEVEPASAGEEDGGSSPLVPILIAIVVLAAISLGAVMYRRRHDGTSESGSSVSPEAG